MKLYVHCESVYYTHIYKCDTPKRTTLGELLAGFAAAYSASVGQPIDATKLRAASGDGHDVDHSMVLSEFLEDKDDVFVTLPTSAGSDSSSDGSTSSSAPVPPSNAAAASADRENLVLATPSGDGDATLQSARAAAPAATSSAGAAAAAAVQQLTIDSSSSGKNASSNRDGARSSSNATSSGGASVAVTALLAAAREAIAVKGMRQAEALLSQVLELDPKHGEALAALARLWLSAGQPARARRYAQRAADAAPADPAALELAGECALAARDPEAAVQHFATALQAVMAAGSGSATATAAAGTKPSRAAEEDLRIATARALYASSEADYRDAAAAVVMEVLGRQADHWEGLFLYARIALGQGLRGDALRVALRLLLRQPEHKGVRALLTTCLEVGRRASRSARTCCAPVVIYQRF